MAASHEPLKDLPSRCANGVLVLDKTRGPTSHDVVARVRRAFHIREVGHAGTLDPMATGVLVVALGEATKLVPWLTAHEKTYLATVTLGVETDTLDVDGREVGRSEPSALLRTALASFRATSPLPGLLREAIEREEGRRWQVPPAFSAIRQGGERAYVRARRGESIDLPSRAVAVRRIELAGCREDPPALDLVVDVAKGYYVRSLARDLAEALGTVGYLSALRRTRSGCFAADEARTVDEPPQVLSGHVVPLARAAARALPAVTLTVAGARDAAHGRLVRAEDIEAGSQTVAGALDGATAWLDARGELVAVGTLDEAGRGRVLRGFVSGEGNHLRSPDGEGPCGRSSRPTS